MRILVTGASGFIGRWIVAALSVLGPDVRLRAWVRRPSAATALERAGHEVVLGDLTDAAIAPAALVDVDLVVHVGGATRAHNPDRLQQVNAEATRQLAEAARSAGAPPFVFLSSLAARGPDDRSTPDDAPASAYGASKRAAERAILEVLPHDRAMILRLGAVYGPGDADLRPLIALAGRGVIPRLLSDHAIQPLFVGDVAELIARLARTTRWPGPGPWDVAGPDVVDWSQVARTLERAVGRSLRVRVPVPRSALFLLAAVDERRAAARGRAPTLDRRRVADLFDHAYTADTTPLEAATGWRPRTSLDVGLRRTVHAIATGEEGP